MKRKILLLLSIFFLHICIRSISVRKIISNGTSTVVPVSMISEDVIDISGLARGSYSVVITDIEGSTHSVSFVKS